MTCRGMGWLGRGSAVCRVLTTGTSLRQFHRGRVGRNIMGTESSLGSTASAPPIESMLFSQHRDKMESGVYKALTGHPFKYDTMSTVQSAIISQHPWEHDYLVKSKTGTGKTLAFLIPAVERRIKQLAEQGHDAGPGPAVLGREGRRSRKGPAGAGVLILSPTRELAKQIAEEASKLVSYHREWSIGCFVGGEDRRRQLRSVDRRADIIVGTPGRIYDLMTTEPRIEAYLKDVQTLIFDEADTLLDMGFRDQMTDIVERLPALENRSTFMFSATISREVKTIAREMLRPDFKYMDLVGKDEVNLHQHVPQSYAIIQPTEMIQHITKLIREEQEKNPKAKIIVFFNTTKIAQLVARICNQLRDTLPNPRMNMSTLTGAMSQEARTRVSNRFRESHYGGVMFTTDVSARGIDYPNVTRVIQVGIPSSLDSYIHRTGRTGRAGREGQGNLLLFPFERNFVKRVLSSVPLTKDEIDDSAISQWTIDHRVEVERALDQAQDTDAGEAFASALGYYISKASSLGVSTDEMVDDLKQLFGPGLDCTEPSASPAFLAKLGAGPPSRRPFFSRDRDTVGSRTGYGGRIGGFSRSGDSGFTQRSGSEGGYQGKRYDRPRQDRSEYPSKSYGQFDKPRFDKPRFDPSSSDRPTRRYSRPFDDQ